MALFRKSFDARESKMNKYGPITPYPTKETPY